MGGKNNMKKAVDIVLLPQLSIIEVETSQGSDGRPMSSFIINRFFQI